MLNPAFVPIDYDDIYWVKIHYNGFSKAIVNELTDVVNKYEHNACYVTGFTKLVDNKPVTSLAFAKKRVRDYCIESLNAVLFEPKKSFTKITTPIVTTSRPPMKVVGNAIVQQGGTTKIGGMTFTHHGETTIHDGMAKGTMIQVGEHSIVLPANYTTFHPSRNNIIVDDELYFDVKRPDLGYWPDRKKEADKVAELERKIRLLESASPVIPADFEEADSGKCIMCLSESVNVMFIKCRHICLCKTCSIDSYTSDECPICRTHGEREIVYIP